jgi:SAM-dependent methyltransferase
VDLIPREKFLEADSTNWAARQQHFLDWLKAQDSENRDQDLTFYRKVLGDTAAFTGYILDIGGGESLARQVANASMGYVTVDPEPFPSSADKVIHLCGVAEFLPFKAGSFDVVFCIATLNHTSRPELAVKEMLRVLSAGGVLLVGYEEEPAVLECLRAGEWAAFRRALYERVASLISPAVQPDHITVRRRDVHTWLDPYMDRERTVFTNARGVLEIVEYWRKTRA